MVSMGINICSHDFLKKSCSSIFFSNCTGFVLIMVKQFISQVGFSLMLIFKLKFMTHTIFLDNFTQWLIIFIGFSNVKWVHTFQMSLSAPYKCKLMSFWEKKYSCGRQTNDEALTCYTIIIRWDFFFYFLTCELIR